MTAAGLPTKPGDSLPAAANEGDALTLARNLLVELSVTEAESFPFVATARIDYVIRALLARV